MNKQTIMEEESAVEVQQLAVTYYLGHGSDRVLMHVTGGSQIHWRNLERFPGVCAILTAPFSKRTENRKVLMC